MQIKPDEKAILLNEWNEGKTIPVWNRTKFKLVVYYTTQGIEIQCHEPLIDLRTIEDGKFR